jgi:transposase InsO family protein
MGERSVPMPWKESIVPDERLQFVLSCLKEEESMSALCRRYGISRPVGYKWLERYQERGKPGLANRSSAPRSHPNQIEAEMERRILLMRSAHPSWGARKLLAALARECHGQKIDLPAASTVGEMLKRAGLVVPRRRRSRSAWAPPGPDISAPAGNGPNCLWCADFKGWFRTGDGSRCDPMTITDAFSRYLLRCRIVKQLSYLEARGLFEAAFEEFGLPQAIKTDNGSPFATTGPLGLSRLTVWWMRLGITHQRIDPGKPQQNASHERMHGTLNREAASPPAWNLRAQQRRFDIWRKEYNTERPHEGLPAMATPGSLYAPSSRPFPQRLAEVEYPQEYLLRRIDTTGKFSWHSHNIFVSHALEGETIGLRRLVESAPQLQHEESEDAEKRYWIVRFVTTDLGVFDAKRIRMLSPREQRHLLK